MLLYGTERLLKKRRTIMNLVLKHEGFEANLVLSRQIYEGAQYLFRFKNGYGASVVKHHGSYGHSKDLWELAVIVFENETDNDFWHLTYSTPITDDVEGCLTDEEVCELLRKIKEL
jgi:hypothetical protein